MKKEDLPQDESALENFSREVCYVKNSEGNYETALSRGWEIKKDALDNAWDEVNERVEEARRAVKDGSKSPVYYFMELRLMDLPVLSGYTGFWTITIKRHFKPAVFKGLSEWRLHKYAEVFEITTDELKNFKG